MYIYIYIYYYVSLSLVSDRYRVFFSVKWNCRNTKMTSSHRLNLSLKMRGAIPPKICTYSGTGLAVGRAITSMLRAGRPRNRCSIPCIGREFLLSYHVKAGTEPQQADSSIWVLHPGIERSKLEAYHSLRPCWG